MGLQWTRVGIFRAVVGVRLFIQQVFVEYLLVLALASRNET